MDDLIVEFLTETTESLAVLDQELVRFEQTPNDREILKNIFRLMHTIKGTCGFLGLPRLEKVAHAGEDVLGKFRDGELEVTPGAVSLILASIDCIREILSVIEATGKEPNGDDGGLIGRLRAVAEGRGDTAPEIATAPVADNAPSTAVTISAGGFPVAAELLAEVEAALAQGARAATDDEMAEAMKAERGKESVLAVPLPEPVKSVAPAKTAPMNAESASAPAEAGGKDAPKESAIAAQTIRVNVDVLENLMTLVSEMVLTRNNLLQLARGQEDSEFTAPLQRLSHITSDLQEGIMKTRMQPIGNAWSKLPRIIRDLSIELGKKIDLKMTGAETELDRQVLEKIKDPLTHMVRNSADHGLEGPEERVAAGKSEEGTIVLKAFHEGGHIIIEISDDGRGLNVDKIKKKIVENGLASEADLAGMDDAQIQQFILRPGFSTAEKITNVSGRGVGMDVVKTNIEEIGGTVQFKSARGKGSVFTIKIPLTLAIVSALIVECGGDRFAIPQLAVRELVRVASGVDNRIESINGAPVLRLRTRLLPLVSMRKLLGLEGVAQKNPGEYYIVVTQIGAHEFGMIVDKVFDTEEIVVKPVAPVLRHVACYSGNTILGDGSVIMILDPNGVAAGMSNNALAAHVEVEHASAHSRQTTALLIFRAGGPERKAVPMTLVARLEEVDLSKVEQVNGCHVVQYRDHLMPLLSFDPDHRWVDKGKCKVLVFTDRDRAMGLVVDEIVDIAETHLEIEIGSEREGVIGSAIVAGKATEILDIGHYLTQVHRDWFGPVEDADAPSTASSRRRVLLVDDSPFFRSLLTPYLSAAGFDVLAAEHAEAAVDMLESGIAFDVIVSDIEMPGMSGFEFAEKLGADPRWSEIPLYALSSNAGPRQIERGRKAGFLDFIAKTRRSDLLNVLNRAPNKMGEAA